MDELAPGLRRWSAWRGEWDENVGCVAVETSDGLVLIDPLDPPPEVDRAEHVLLTVFWHDRSAAAVGARHVWAGRRSARPLTNRGIVATDVSSADAALPGGIRAFHTARPAEVAYWLPEHHSVVVGDVLLGAGAKPRATSDPLRLCPERWLGKATHDDLRVSLRPLLDLPVERVLCSHGEPVLREGLRELERVLASGSS